MLLHPSPMRMRISSSEFALPRLLFLLPFSPTLSIPPAFSLKSIDQPPSTADFKHSGTLEPYLTPLPPPFLLWCRAFFSIFFLPSRPLDRSLFCPNTFPLQSKILCTFVAGFCLIFLETRTIPGFTTPGPPPSPKLSSSPSLILTLCLSTPIYLCLSWTFFPRLVVQSVPIDPLSSEKKCQRNLGSLSVLLLLRDLSFFSEPVCRPSPLSLLLVTKPAGPPFQ